MEILFGGGSNKKDSKLHLRAKKKMRDTSSKKENFWPYQKIHRGNPGSQKT